MTHKSISFFPQILLLLSSLVCAKSLPTLPSAAGAICMTYVFLLFTNARICRHCQNHPLCSLLCAQPTTQMPLAARSQTPPSSVASSGLFSYHVPRHDCNFLWQKSNANIGFIQLHCRSLEVLEGRGTYRLVILL